MTLRDTVNARAGAPIPRRMTILACSDRVIVVWRRWGLALLVGRDAPALWRWRGGEVEAPRWLA